MNRESRQRGEGAWAKLADDSPPGVTIEALKLIEPLNSRNRSIMERPHDSQPVGSGKSLFQPESLRAAAKAGEGACRQTLIPDRKGQSQPRGNRSIEP